MTPRLRAFIGEATWILCATVALAVVLVVWGVEGKL